MRHMNFDFSSFIPHLCWFVTQGKLMLTNTLDGTEQVYRLLGTGQKPLPLDHILIECPAKQRSSIYSLTSGPASCSRALCSEQSPIIKHMHCTLANQKTRAVCPDHSLNTFLHCALTNHKTRAVCWPIISNMLRIVSQCNSLPP